jgi:hypothetical protein
MTINRAQKQTPKRPEIYPLSTVFPMASSMWHFLDPLHLKESLLQALRGVNNV